MEAIQDLLWFHSLWNHNNLYFSKCIPCTFHKWHVEPRALFNYKSMEGHAIMGMDGTMWTAKYIFQRKRFHSQEYCVLNKNGKEWWIVIT